MSGVVQTISKANAWREVVFIVWDQRVFNRRHSRERSVTRLHKSVWWTSRRGGRSLPKLIRQKVDKPPASIDRITVIVITQPRFNVRRELIFPVVLRKPAPIVDSQRAIKHARTDNRNTVAGQEVVKARKDHLPAREGVEIEIDLRTAVFAAKAQTMIAGDNGQSVAEGKRVDARRLVGKRRRTEREQSGNRQRRHARKQIVSAGC